MFDNGDTTAPHKYITQGANSSRLYYKNPVQMMSFVLSLIIAKTETQIKFIDGLIHWEKGHQYSFIKWLLNVFPHIVLIKCQINT